MGKSCWLPSRVSSLTVVILTATATSLVGVEGANGDILIRSVSRTSGAPGESVDLLISCGGCARGYPDTARLPGTARMPVALLPLDSSAHRRRCEETPSQRLPCTPLAPRPPDDAPYIPLGVAAQMDAGEPAAEIEAQVPMPVRRQGRAAVSHFIGSLNRLRFRIPDVRPGRYRYVLYCNGCRPGRGGALITCEQPRCHLQERYGDLLRVEEAVTAPVVVARAGTDAGIGFSVGLAAGS